MSGTDVIRTIQSAADAPQDPIGLFRQWLDDAGKAGCREPNAMGLSTLGQNGTIRSRVVLLKELSADGFVFYTNRDSLKGKALDANPFAALNFYWESLGRQVCIEGSVEQVSDAESDAYFATRPRGSRIGAWASQQSRPLESRSQLEDRVREYEKKFEGQDTVPRPPYWGGYLLRPDRIEFWHAGDYRLHSRIAYTRSGGEWDREMLFP